MDTYADKAPAHVIVHMYIYVRTCTTVVSSTLKVLCHGSARIRTCAEVE